MSQPAYKKIGEYRFYSQDEYKEGLNDLKKIKTLMGKGDLTNPKLAARLYQQLLSYPDMFESCIGEEFTGKLLHCSNGYPERLDKFFYALFLDYKSPAADINNASVNNASVNNISVNAYINNIPSKEISAGGHNYNHQAFSKHRRQLKESQIEVEIEQKPDILRKVVKKKKNHKKEIAIFIAGMLTCFIMYTAGDAAYYKFSTDRSIKKLEKLAGCILEPVEAQVSSEHIDMDMAASGGMDNVLQDGTADLDGEGLTDLLSVSNKSKDNSLEVLHKYSALYEMNQDIAGWIKIDDTEINYPVMQTKEDEEYYIYRDFDKETDKTGLPFIDARCDIVNTTSNLIIYAHNMKNGTMFAPLLQYKQEGFYKEHKIIHFDTIYEAADYEIVAAFLTQIAYQHEDVFRYYNFIDAETKEEYDAFVGEIKKLSYYDTGITPEYGDQLITLSTCDRSIEDGRIVVVARRITGNN